MIKPAGDHVLGRFAGGMGQGAGIKKPGRCNLSPIRFRGIAGRACNQFDDVGPTAPIKRQRFYMAGKIQCAAYFFCQFAACRIQQAFPLVQATARQHPEFLQVVTVPYQQDVPAIIGGNHIASAHDLAGKPPPSQPDTMGDAQDLSMEGAGKGIQHKCMMGVGRRIVIHRVVGHHAASRKPAVTLP